MEYIIGLVAFIAGLIVDRFLPSYFSKKGENLATKEDIGKITSEIEKVKNIFKDQYDLSKTEREFYDGMAKTIYKFLAKIKRYEKENGANTATKTVVEANLDLKAAFYEFIDSSNEFIGKSYVFLKEESYTNLKNALNTNTTFNELAKNLLYAMRKSLHPETTLEPKAEKRLFAQCYRRITCPVCEYNQSGSPPRGLQPVYLPGRQSATTSREECQQTQGG